MDRANGEIINFRFRLSIEDDWPPVSVEYLPCAAVMGGYRVSNPPLFIKNMSVGDIIDITVDVDGIVDSWKHVVISNLTTIWMMNLKVNVDINEVLLSLRNYGCSAVRAESIGAYSIDVPEEVPFSVVDNILEILDEDELAVVFPSMLHPE